MCHGKSPSLSTSTDSSGLDNLGHYSVVTVAIAVYLMITISAADLWVAVALLLESRVERFWQRKAFGAALLVSFAGLMISWTSVLYSSLEDVSLLIGAAAVLFIDDVVSATVPSTCVDAGARWLRVGLQFSCSFKCSGKGRNHAQTSVFGKHTRTHTTKAVNRTHIPDRGRGSESRYTPPET